MRTILFLLLASSVAATTGCSFSDSSGSISDSISSPSESLSKSSDSSKSSSSGGDSGGGQEQAPEPESAQDTASYRRDVSQLTLTYLERGGEIGAFRSGIGDLAEARGIVDWEADPATTQAIGTGAGRAGLQEPEFAAFSERLVGHDAAKLDQLRIGYERSATSAPTASQAATTNPDAS